MRWLHSCAWNIQLEAPHRKVEMETIVGTKWKQTNIILTKKNEKRRRKSNNLNAHRYVDFNVYRQRNMLYKKIHSIKYDNKLQSSTWDAISQVVESSNFCYYLLISQEISKIVKIINTLVRMLFIHTDMLFSRKMQ